MTFNYLEYESAKQSAARLSEIERLKTEASKLPQLEQQRQQYEQQQAILEQSNTAKEQFKSEAQNYLSRLQDNNEQLTSALLILADILSNRQALGNQYDELFKLAAVACRDKLTSGELTMSPQYLQDRQSSLAKELMSEVIGARLAYDVPAPTMAVSELVNLLASDNRLNDVNKITEQVNRQAQLNYKLNSFPRQFSGELRIEPMQPKVDVAFEESQFVRRRR